MKIILTGFEPFNGSTINPSAKVVDRFSEGAFPDHTIIRKVLPVDSELAGGWLKNSIIDLQPDIIILLGEASLRAVVSIEKVAINWMDYRIADNTGNQVVDKPVIENGPDAYFSTLPVNLIFEQVKAAGIPMEISLSAGAFLCNQVFYTGLYYSQLLEKKSMCGFIHLPPLPEQVVEKNAITPSMPVAMSLRAVEIAIQTCIQFLEGQ